MKRELVAPKTSAPTANPSVFGPSFSTTPDISDPSVSGYVCGKSLLPVRTNASQGPTPAAETRTRTSRSPGSGKSISSMTITSGGPGLWTRAARMHRPHLSHRNRDGCQHSWDGPCPISEQCDSGSGYKAAQQKTDQ